MDTAIELLEGVTDRCQESVLAPGLLAELADLERNRSDYREVFALLDRAEELATEVGIYHAYARYRISGLRGQTLLQLGLLKQAQLAIWENEGHSLELIKFYDRPDQARDRAVIALGPQIYGFNIELALHLTEAAEQRATRLLDDPALRDAPEVRGRVRLMLGQALRRRIRAALAGSDLGDPGELLERTREEFEAALASELSSEEHFKALVDLADVCSLAGDLQQERALLRELYKLPTSGIEAEWLGDRACFRVRRLLRDAERWRPLVTALDGLVTVLAEVGGGWPLLPRSLEGERVTVRAWRELCEATRRRRLTDAQEELERRFDEIRADWLRAPRPSEGLGFLHWDEQRLLVATWMQVLLELHGPDAGAERALEAISSAHSIGTLVQRVASPSQPAVDWLAWRAGLSEGAGVLILLPSLDSTHLLALDAGPVIHAEVPASRAKLESLARSVASYVRKPPGPDDRERRATARADARTLAEALLAAPIRERLEAWTSVTIVGAELLGDPCLEWLPLGDGLLGDRLATSYVPSLELAQLLETRCEVFDPDQLTVVVPTGPACQRPVELTRQEEERLRELSNGDLRTGAQADLAGPLGRGILAIAAHGQYVPGDLRPAHLVLAEGLAGCDDLERAQLPPLVCLLACGAARGPILPGDDGAVHLGGAALVGGAATVLLARNDLETAASLALFELFVAELRAGAQPDEALRRARVALPQRRGEWRHPFYTQSLSLFGLGRLPAR